ncbi:hypothetical protein [Nocardioides sp. InS609-2]|uniref:hypothetical protein n=1 Tax=Nocardioides sp. InS609-2 TaxID=2760705 RepID=UPI0020C0B960|nr:hypothetical protein [Nocardioides sp. InS609-2]
MNLWADRKAKAELARLLKGRPNFHVRFSESQVAASLWDYGEDRVAERALVMSPGELADIQAIAASYEEPDYPLPLTGQRITHNHVCAFAAISYFEGRVRPLTRTRRRPEKDRPLHLRPSPPAAGL